jgi:hypothetical protein
MKTLYCMIKPIKIFTTINKLSNFTVFILNCQEKDLFIFEKCLLIVSAFILLVENNVTIP